MLTESDCAERRRIINEYGMGSGRSHSIVALTMADDPRCDLESLRTAWITEADRTAKGMLLNGRNRARALLNYLFAARQVSTRLCRVLRDSGDEGSYRLAKLLALHSTRSWLVPVTAARNFNDALAVIAHADLPLLVALCEYGNALM
jgi:hypothetical protein